jgi:aspartyl/asparaginyl beta-hydroxylase (cupin superfamily)
MSTNPSIEDLVQAAHQQMRLGRLDDAAQLWKKVRAIVPDHPQALFHLGRYLLFRKDPRAAIELLQRAATITPREPAIQLNLAYAFQALGESGGELQALDRALAIDPYFYPALFLKGATFERQGRKRAAARVYKDALSAAPATVPAELKEQVAHAQQVVRLNAEDLAAHLRSTLAHLKARHPDTDLARFEECKDALIGTKRIFTSQPTMLYFPRLPAIQFYDVGEFPWLSAFEAATATIRDELIAYMREDDKEFRPYVRHAPGVPLNQWAELNHSPRWSALFLLEDGTRDDSHCARFPRTAAALEEVPLCIIPGFAPAAFFSTLEPHTRIPAHTGVTNARLIVHLPLIVPEGCGFRVGNEVREWRSGKALIFDDTIEHEAWNDSEELRVVLICDIWNPYLSLAERDYVAELLQSSRAYYAEQ